MMSTGLTLELGAEEESKNLIHVLIRMWINTCIIIERIYIWTLPRFPTSYVVIIVLFNELRWELIVTFVDIGGIVDHYCLNFHFIIWHL